MDWESGIVTAVVLVAAMTQLWSLAHELPHAMGTAKKKKKIQELLKLSNKKTSNPIIKLSKGVQ